MIPCIWLTGLIHLQSNVNLHVEKGALVLFSPRFNDYPLRQQTTKDTTAFGAPLRRTAADREHSHHGHGI